MKKFINCQHQGRKRKGCLEYAIQFCNLILLFNIMTNPSDCNDVLSLYSDKIIHYLDVNQLRFRVQFYDYIGSYF